jgi:hypothetical protein
MDYIAYREQNGVFGVFVRHFIGQFVTYEMVHAGHYLKMLADLKECFFLGSILSINMSQIRILK